MQIIIEAALRIGSHFPAFTRRHVIIITHDNLVGCDGEKRQGKTNDVWHVHFQLKVRIREYSDYFPNE